MSGSSSPDSSAGMRIGRYEVLQTIGRGAMGIVYSARHDLTGQVVALKTLHLEQVGESIQGAEQRFMREIQAAVTLHHPGIVRVYEFDRAQVRGLGELIYYAMERIEGQTLHEMIQPGPLPAADAAAICVQVCEALDFAHRNGIVHRDVKPANIFVSNQRRVVLTDFGICKIDSLGTLTVAGAVVGTLPFLAPEQAAEGPLDARADVFSVGAVLYTLLTKFYLRSTKATAALMQAATPGKDVEQVRKMTGFDPGLVEVLARAVAFEPDDRQPTARALADALRPFAGTVPYPPGVTAESDQTLPPPPALAGAREDTLVDPFPRPDDNSATLPAAGPPDLAPGASAPAPRPVSGLDLSPLADPSEADPFAELAMATAEKTRPDNNPTETAPWPDDSQPEAQLKTVPDSSGGPPTGAAPLDPQLLANQQARALLEQRPESHPAPGQAAASGTARRLPPSPAAAPPVSTSHKLLIALAAVVALSVLGLTANALLGLRSVVVAIESLPEGAEVLIDGEPVGKTPLTVPLQRGRDRVSLEVFAREREPYREQIELPLFGGVAPLTVAMPLRRAKLKVDAPLAGAQVLIDGQPSCHTPCTVEDFVPRRRQLVQVVQPGCAPAGRVIESAPAERLVWHASLRPLDASALALLQVLSDRQPVVLDRLDRSAAFRAGGLLLAAGDHLLEVGEGEDRREHLLHLVAGTTQRIDLRRLGAPPPQPRLKRQLLHGDQDDDGEVTRADEQLDAQGDSPDALADYGIYLLSRGQAAEALRYFMQALTLAPHNPRGHRGIIAAAIALDDAKLARGQMMSFLNLQTTLHDDALLKQVFGGVQKAERCAAAIAAAEESN